MAAILSSARVPPRVDPQRVWRIASLETMRIGEQTILFVNVGKDTLAVLHFSPDELLAFIRKLMIG